jgi:hypothetical protein
MMMSGNVKLKTMKINAQIMSTCASRCRLSWRFINEICIFVVDWMMVTEICGTNARRLWCTTAADRTNHETTKAHIWRRQWHESDCNQYARRIGYRSTGIAAASTFTWGTFAVVYFPYLTLLFSDRKYWSRRTSDEWYCSSNNTTVWFHMLCVNYNDDKKFVCECDVIVE